MKRRRKRRRCNIPDKPKEEAAPEDGTTMEVQSSYVSEDSHTQSFSTSPPKQEEKKEESAIETESKPTELQATPSPKRAHTSFRVPEGTSGIEKMNPTLLLKSVFKPAVGYLCDLCSQSFASTLQLLKHKEFHEDSSENLPTKETEIKEPKQIQEILFSCNMCDQSFATTHILKRHKLLHVRDGRKCPWCGVLFCQRHNHVVFLPQTQSEQECNGDKSEESEELDESKEPKECKECEESEKTEFEPEETEEPEEPEESEELKKPDEPKEPEESKEPETNDRPHYIMTKTQTQDLPMHNDPPATPAHLPEIISLIPPPSQERNFKKLSKLEELSLLPERHVQPPPPQNLKLPAYLQVFSPQRLTSVFLQVQRNYSYIMEKAKNQKKLKKKPSEKIVIPQCPQPAVPPPAQSDVPIERERIAYDMEIVL